VSIFSHLVIGANDVEKARAFYDEVLGTLGIKRVYDDAERSAWGTGAPELMVGKPLNGEPATHGNGGTIGFSAASTEAVDRFHAAALANGGSCEGEPGPRAFPGLYAAYARDPDGNKICAIHFQQA
jgi:catechol 2,3-dioxygenase-like lactoylglutathione lyase family enzyme